MNRLIDAVSYFGAAINEFDKIKTINAQCIIPEDIIDLDLNQFKDLVDFKCNSNNLKSIICNEKLQMLICYNNRLEKLELNYGLELLDCRFNTLDEYEEDVTSIQYIPPTLKTIYCRGTHFDFKTQIRIIKHCLENKCSVDYNDITGHFFMEFVNYKKYLILLLELSNTYIIKYL
jgi:hypothetical protein